ncbi:MAG TPA: FimV/HubP family polar landmark protein [Orrella sp.]
MKNKTKNVVTTLAMRFVFACLIAAAGFMLAPHALAFEVGHSRVVSAPGQPLTVVVPIKNLNAGDAASLAVRLASPDQWQAAGLTPPVALGTLSLNVQAGADESSRLINVRSPEVSEQTVIDVLLDVSTSAANRTVQTSIIVPPPPRVRLAAETITVQRGDTLIGIAEQFPVQGADLYQQLWALFSTNPDAFMRENMNLLKAGASLSVPDADAVRAVDPAFAKAQYLAQVRAFRQGSGGGQGDVGIAADASTQTLQNQSDEGQPKTVEAAAQEPDAPISDEVRLTPAEGDSVSAQADALVSGQRQLAEQSDRQAALEQNIDDLKNTIAESVKAQRANTAQAGNAQAGNEQSVTAAITSNDRPLSAAGNSGASASAQDALAPEDSQNTAADSAPGGEQNALKADSPNTNDSNTNASNNTDSNASDSNASADPQVGAAIDTNQNIFTRASHWVADNTTAAIALLLALIALILAWALRASKNKSGQVAAAQDRVERTSASFEEKLKDIDLSLDDKPQEAPGKPDGKV